MAFKSAANGIVSKGKTKGKNFGDSGPTDQIEKGGRGSAGVTDDELMKLGRGMAKVANQKRG